MFMLLSYCGLYTPQDSRLRLRLFGIQFLVDLFGSLFLEYSDNCLPFFKFV